MISYIKGKIEEKEPPYVIIDVGGIGYHINITLNTFSKIKDLSECKLFTTQVIREDAHLLYGFFDKDERQTFEALISISGVGPSTALMVLSTLSPEEFRRAIVHDQVKVIQGVKGIGAKTAQRIILELKDKLSKMLNDDVESKIPVGSHNILREEALSALITLGIPRITAEKNVNRILKSEPDNLSLEDIIKLALKNA